MKELEQYISDNKWDYTMSNKIAFLYVDFITRGYLRPVSELGNVVQDNIVQVYLDGMHHRYIAEAKYNNYAEIINKVGLDLFINNYKIEAEQEIKELENISKEVDKELETKNLADAINNIDQRVIKCFTVLNLATIFSKLVERNKLKIKDKVLHELGRVRDRHAKIAWQFVQVYDGIIFPKIVSETKFKLEDLHYLTVAELVDSIKKEKLVVSDKELADRRKGMLLAFFDNKKIFITGDKVEELKQILIGDLDSGLKGRIAYQGKVTGVIRRIDDHRRYGQIKQDEILASYKTTNHFLPFAKRVKAVLAQEGGMTSHAAIIAREFKVPCIVGIKNLMSLVKDGDQVEVDANKGIVKILKPFKSHCCKKGAVWRDNYINYKKSSNLLLIL